MDKSNTLCCSFTQVKITTMDIRSTVSDSYHFTTDITNPKFGSEWKRFVSSCGCRVLPTSSTRYFGPCTFPSVIGVGATLMLLASYYGPGFHGNLTASGTRFDSNASRAAHKSLPFGTKLRVCYVGCEVVTITDRGPYIHGRDLDLSEGTAKRIGFIHNGIGNVTVTRLN
jgi:rare lipoprotein A